jgi:hypothetical protein
MTRERTPSSGPLPFNAAAGRAVTVAVGFVALVALLFGGLGAWQQRDLSAAEAPAPAPAPPAPPAPAPAPAPPTDDEDADVGEDDTTEGEDAGNEEPAPAPPTEPAVRPNSEVSVQVLDGISGGGSAAVTRVVATLREAGFRIAAQNTGRAYDVTTVFYNEGYEAEARRVAQAIDASVVSAMSSLPPERRLSPGVNVHVIVGADRG